MNLGDLRKQMQTGNQARVSLEGTTERVTAATNGKVTIENIAYTKEGKELIIAQRIETTEALQARKAKLEADLKRVDALLEQVK